MNAKFIAPLLMATAAATCGAAEIHVLSAAAMQTVFKEVLDEFERSSGHKVLFTYTTMGAITERVLGGERTDLVIGSSPSLARLVKEGKVRAESTAIVARVGVGAVVPSGTPVPPFATPDDVREALLAARTVVYANPAGGGAAGIHVTKVIERLGVSDQVKAKTRFGAGGDVTEVALAQGAGTLGLTQISEIVAKPGADYVGPLPASLQNYTGVTAGIPPASTQPHAAAELIAFLKTPPARAAMQRRGMEPIANGD
jgi:molybdate transport system substrate-binding protein